MPQRLDFKAIAEDIDIFAVASHLGLVVKANRATCPACDTERAIEFYPDTNTFYCHAGKGGSDCISLYAHVRGYQGQYRAAKELSEHFLHAKAAEVSSTPPTSPEARTAKSQPSSTKAFDPEAYAAKLTYSEEVAALGITEDDANRLSIGYASTGLHRGRVVFPVRNIDGSIAGFVSATDLKVPNTWQKGNVVPLRRKA